MNERNQGTVFIDKKTGRVNTGLVIYNKNWAYWVDPHECSCVLVLTLMYPYNILHSSLDFLSFTYG